MSTPFPCWISKDEGPKETNFTVSYTMPLQHLRETPQTSTVEEEDED